MTLLHIDITVSDTQWQPVCADIDIEHICNLTYDHIGGRDASELSIVLSDDATIQELNAQYRGKDTATNVLSFPMDSDDEEESHLLLGDIVLAFETILREAKEQKKTLKQHVTHLIIHGLLHLLGYDHETEDEAHEMEQIEITLLSQLGIANPYDS